MARSFGDLNDGYDGGCACTLCSCFVAVYQAQPILSIGQSHQNWFRNEVKMGWWREVLRLHISKMSRDDRIIMGSSFETFNGEGFAQSKR